MAHFLFIDESGHDHKASPYEVLAGVAIQDKVLWNLINDIHDAEFKFFGRRYSEGNSELKGSKILKTKVFYHASLNVQLNEDEIPKLAKEALDEGEKATAKHLKALALAKLAYVKALFEICAKYHCHAFASIIETDAKDTATEGLRKDYGYLFERFYYYLDDQRPREQGIIVFDELEKTKSHLLVGQAHAYFKDSAIGKQRANLIVPEPFFVHSDLTTGVQIADLIAYIVSWGFRNLQINKPKRDELSPFVNQVAKLRYLATRNKNGKTNFEIWSFAYIPDLRTRFERDDAA